jgi:hypothetical protein
MLHGHATSALIFKAQTAPFRTNLDKSFSFDFVDGPYPCAVPRGLSLVISSAYTWMKTFDTAGVRDAVGWLTEYIEKNGPYDCICCFSKASVVVAAMLMYGARETDEAARERFERIAPKSLVFINGSIEYDFLQDLGFPISAEARQKRSKTEQMVHSRTEGVSKLSRTLVRPGAGQGLWDDTSKLLHNPSKLPPPNDCFGVDFGKMPQDLVINMPTVHIVGAKDPIWPSGVQLAYLCDADKRSFYDHRGGHDLPRTQMVGADIAKIFKELAKKVAVA